MHFTNAKIFICSTALLWVVSARGQEPLQNPELKQMYAHGREFLALRNYSQAVTTFRQALLLAPGNTAFRLGLAEASYRAGDYPTAERTLTDVGAATDAPVDWYHILALALAAQDKLKEADAALANGLSRFPLSGQLWYDQGCLYRQKMEYDRARTSWLIGMDKEPAFAENYREAALAMLQQEQYETGLFVLEIYLDLPHPEDADDSLKAILFHAYDQMLNTIGKNSGDGTSEAGRYTVAIRKLFTSLTPVVSDGVHTETLAMLRARFLMDWRTRQAAQLPFPFFDYLLGLMADGKFDIYNEWLFGKADSKAQYDAWNIFHAGDLDRFLAWRVHHPYVPHALNLGVNERSGKR